MKFIPKSILGKLYNRTSLRNGNGSVRFSVKNRLSPATLRQISHVHIDGQVVADDRIRVSAQSGALQPISEIRPDSPMDFPLGILLNFHLDIDPLEPGQHDIKVVFDAPPFGQLKLDVSDGLKTGERAPGAVPRDSEDDYSDEIIRERQAFIHRHTGADLQHISSYSFDPHAMHGNIEHFTGAAQVPLGFAGPLMVDGEHAQGEFYVPLACTEGTLVASYNRGMKVLHRSGGVKCAVVGDNMQRAPVFIFEDAGIGPPLCRLDRGKNRGNPGLAAEATDPFVQLKYVDYYLSNKFAFLRFNFKTGDAAGMNMVGKATFAACNWILQNCDVVEIQRFFLESNFRHRQEGFDDQHDAHARKRVTAEAVVKREALLEIMDADTESVYQHYKALPLGSIALRRQQQRLPRGQRNHRHLPGHRPGRGQRVRVVGGHHVLRTEAKQWPLHVHHTTIPDRRHLWRRNGVAHTEGVPGGAGLLWGRQCIQVRRDRRRHGSGGWNLAGRSYLLAGLGLQPRPVRAQRSAGS